jgi:hypothetical protein
MGFMSAVGNPFHRERTGLYEDIKDCIGLLAGVETSTDVTPKLPVFR